MLFRSAAAAATAVVAATAASAAVAAATPAASGGTEPRISQLSIYLPCRRRRRLRQQVIFGVVVFLCQSESSCVWCF